MSDAPRHASASASASRELLAVQNDCWNRIGVDGDGTCVELKQVIHCRNCEVYGHAGRGLLDRHAPSEYRTEWGRLLAQPKEAFKRTTQSVVIFSLGAEYLALPTTVFREVTEPRPVHRMPAARNKLLLGLVNIRGELQLCISLGGLLAIKSDPLAASNGRLLVVDFGETWVFPVDNVFCTHQFNAEDVSPRPATLDKALASFSRGTIQWEGRHVGLLDPDAIFASLKGGFA